MSRAPEVPVHSVQFYDESSSLIDRLRTVTTGAVQIGNSVIIVATPEHRADLINKLEQWNVDIRSAARDGRFVMCDAEETLATFMKDGRPDPEHFARTISKLVDDAKKSARSRQKGLMVFGEMVAVLWQRGETAAALELEHLWNNLLGQRAFHLHCAYPRAFFNNGMDATALEAVCRTHTHILDSARVA